MALSPLMTRAVAKHLKPGDNVAALGYPDIVASQEQISAILGGRKVESREDSEAICRRHGLEKRDIPDAHAFFKALGATLDVYDIVKERGCEIPIDLNFPFDNGIRYQFVLDVGTLEHCFNIGQAAFNMADMVKIGGFIVHENPFNWGNHGFYGLNPTWYADFYTENGFELLECVLVDREGNHGDAPHKKRFLAVEREFNVFAVARRLDEHPLTFPVQGKYKSLIKQ